MGAHPLDQPPPGREGSRPVKSATEVQARHDHLLRSIARAEYEDRAAYREQSMLDELCWVLSHPYCVAMP